MQEFSEEELPAAREKDDDPPTSPTVLTRIGSVKSKWGLRRKRASATPSEVVRDERHGAFYSHSAIFLLTSPQILHGSPILLQ